MEDDKIKITLAARIRDNEYAAFGLSGDQGEGKMVNSKDLCKFKSSSEKFES